MLAFMALLQVDVAGLRVLATRCQLLAGEIGAGMPDLGPPPALSPEQSGPLAAAGGSGWRFSSSAHWSSFDRDGGSDCA